MFFPEATLIEILQAKSGGRTVKKDGVYLISRYDPEKEMKNTADGLIAAADSVNRFYILFGSGLVYWKPAFRSKTSSSMNRKAYWKRN
jgi:hypothetical protein